VLSEVMGELNQHLPLSVELSKMAVIFDSHFYSASKGDCK
jgi:hypothetical protein